MLYFSSEAYAVLEYSVAGRVNVLAGSSSLSGELALLVALAETADLREAFDTSLYIDEGHNPVYALEVALDNYGVANVSQDVLNALKRKFSHLWCSGEGVEPGSVALGAPVSVTLLCSRSVLDACDVARELQELVDSVGL